MTKLHVRKTMKNNIILNCLKMALRFIFPLITFPYISRILGTEGLGKVNFSSSVISYFTLFASLGVLNYSIREGAALKNSVKERDKFFDEIFTVNCLSTLLSYVFLISAITVSVKLRDYCTLLIIQSLAMIFNWLGVEWIYNIYEDYFLITLRSFFTQLISLCLMFLFVRTSSDYEKYALITVIANSGAYIFNYLYAVKYYRPKIVLHCNLRKHIVPMAILAANSIATTIYVNSDTTMIGFFMDDHYVGLYSTAVKIYTLMRYVIAAIIASGTPRISYIFNSSGIEQYRDILKKMAKVLMVVSIPAMTGIFMTSREIVLVLSGEAYLDSVPVLRILAVPILFASFSSFCSTYGLVIQRKEKRLLLHTSISALINVILNAFMIPRLGIIGAAITTVISELYVCVVFCLLTDFAAILYSCKRTFISSLISSGGIVVVCTILKTIPHLYLRFGLSVILSIVVYVVVLMIRKEEIVNSILHSKNKRK